MFSRLFVRSLIPAFVFLALAGFFFPTHAFGASDEMIAVVNELKHFGSILILFLFFSSIVFFVLGNFQLASISILFVIILYIFNNFILENISLESDIAAEPDSAGTIKNIIIVLMVPLILTIFYSIKRYFDMQRRIRDTLLERDILHEIEPSSAAETDTEDTIADLGSVIEPPSEPLSNSQVKRKIIKD